MDFSLRENGNTVFGSKINIIDNRHNKIIKTHPPAQLDVVTLPVTLYLQEIGRRTQKVSLHRITRVYRRKIHVSGRCSYYNLKIDNS